MTATRTPLTTDRPTRSLGRAHLLAPTVGTGALMLLYLLARPYGDAAGATTTEAAAAFASTWWVVAHVAGALALACYAWLTVRLADLVPGAVSRLARTFGLGGLVLALPYFGAETFALHVIGREAAAGNAALLDLVEPIRGQPVAIVMFGLGLVLLAASAILLALTWWRSGAGPAWSVWPLTAGMVLFLPHFFLPPGGQMAFGVAYAVAAVILLLGLTRGRLRR